MWNKDHVWLHYVNNIIAADVSSAVFLSSYLRQLTITRNYASALEVFDLQKYKHISHPLKVRAALRDKFKMPFIFVTGKN